MLELVASLVVDLSDRRLSVYNSQQEVDRVISLRTGKASTPTPIFNSEVYTEYRSTMMYGRTYTVPGVPLKRCASVQMRPSASMPPHGRKIPGNPSSSSAAMAVCACR